MKILTKLCFLALPTGLLAAAVTPITPLTLDERTVYRIPVSLTRVTTIRFPGPIHALDGAGVTTDGKVPGLFQLAYKPPNFFFSVRALAPRATANVNVVWNRKTYVLELVESTEPVLSVIFQEPAPVRPVTSANGGSEAPHLSASRLLGLLERAKAYPLLLKHHPQAVENITRVQSRLTSEYDTFTVKVDEIYRFDPEDALVFRLLLFSKRGQEVRYKPQSFAIRVGSSVYHQAISDAAGVIPPTGEIPAYFAIVGRPDGQRNELSPKNEFVILVTPLSTP